ncbi:MAG: molybdopterin dinucleotide binding domain-containing protein, partial [Dehalococcoidia bacterium]|nr:molybdopterin dinucleotide binding domain-containing protein [Dehalococcoidia bacterium]
RPAALIAGIAPGRTAYGEQYHRAAATLAAMTGNVGVHGGDAGASGYIIGAQIYPFMKLGAGMPVTPNPAESRFPPRKNALPHWGGFDRLRTGHMNQAKVADAILKGKAGGYAADYRLLYVVNNNYPNQYPNVNKCVEALKSKNLEFVVVFEQFMTSAAQFADIVLPVNTCLERSDITGVGEGFIGYMGKAVDSVGESRSHLEICTALAERLGIPDFSDRTEDEWIKQIATGSPYVTDYDKFKKDGLQKIKLDEPYVAFKAQIEDPEHNPFPTPSGRIEIYCQRLADMNDPLLPAIPKYLETWESRNDPLAERYPLQLITTHMGRRAHSQYDNIPWLRELELQRVTLNPADAEVRGISNGDMVRVFNDRGATMLPARVSGRIMQGVVDIPQGAWYTPDERGVDRGGCANMLTKDEHSPGGAFASNTSLVEIERV